MARLPMATRDVSNYQAVQYFDLLVCKLTPLLYDIYLMCMSDGINANVVPSLGWEANF